MTFLKRVGLIMLQATKLIVRLQAQAGAVVGMVRAAVNELDQIFQLVIQVEAMGAALALTGPQKLQAAVAAATQIILQSALVAGKKIAQPEVFKRGVSRIVEGVVDVLNSLDGEVKTEDRA